MRIMGLDYGSKTVGVSVCDPLGITAQAVETIVRKEEDKLRRTCRRIEALIQERQDARKARNFARADEIRNELLEKGIILEDTREGVKWKKA